MNNKRVDWVDTAKGICIVLVVMLHSVTGVEANRGDFGWMHAIIEFCAPFRMPDFFLISGLFLASVIDRDWKLYIDRKVVHFAYFYVLWLSIQFIIKMPSFTNEMGFMGTVEFYLMSFVDPFSMLWFIYMLPIFFVVSKLAHDWKIPWQLVLGAAALLQIAPIHTGWLLIDSFASRFVYFYAGFVFAPHIFALADWARERVFLSIGLLVTWGLVNAILVFNGLSTLPFLSLALGAAGAGAIILTSALIVKVGTLDYLRVFGENSIVIYLSFFFPMAVTREILLRFGMLDTGTISLIVNIVAVSAPMVLFWMIRKTNVGWFLFKRPKWAYLNGTYLKQARATSTIPLTGKN
ncbi:acyltransferase family protein [Roseibium sp.]|uniref:acyltransferase family protein n=1 Tax=Roseibium sp. TaxID=1936156 RepID=UPI003D0B56CD